MKIIVAGGRWFNDKELLERECREFFSKGDILMQGGAKGADELAMYWASENDVRWEEYPAEWDKHGKMAGPIRNLEMAKKADALLAFWDGKSRGTRDMINKANRNGLTVRIVRYD